VGFQKADSQEKRLLHFFQPIQVGNGPGSNPSVKINGIMYIHGFVRGPSAVTGCILPDVVFEMVIPPGGGHFGPPDLIPAIPAVVHMVEYLSIGNCIIAVIPEVTGEGDDCGCFLVSPCLKGSEAVSGGPEAGEQAGPGGATDRYVAVSPFEQEALRCQLVDMRRMDVGCPVTIQFGSQIINCNEKNIGMPVITGIA
jgi:hypothetical protein